LPRPVGVIDSSCVIALDWLNLLPQLALIFDRLLIPKAVRAELYRRRATKHRLKSLLEAYAFIQPCDNYDQTAVDVLMTERSPLSTKDRGEIEAVVQATPLGAIVIVDDRWGRRLSESYSLEHHGTIWILERLHALGLLTAPGVRKHLLELIRRRIHLSLQAANELLHRLGEEHL
jgi:predicted nucleic acid-binding protein